MWLFVGLGSFFGAVSRYFIYESLKPYQSKFPFATFVVNSLGSFFFGLVVGLGIEFQTPSLYIFLTGGFLGAFTTFSTFSVESITFWLNRSYKKFLVYVIGHFIIGISFVSLGFYLI